MSAKLIPSGLGADRKKLAILGGLVVAMGGLYYYQSSSSGPTVIRTVPTQTSSSTSQRVIAPQPTGPRGTSPKSRPRGRGSNEEFHPTLPTPESFDVTKVDPTLRRDLLARLQGIGDVGGSRSLFEFYVPPPPPVILKPTPPPPPPTTSSNNDKPKGPPPPPPAPPKTKPDFRYFGYAGNSKAVHKGLFVSTDNESGDALGVGELVKKRWKVVSLTDKTAELEDTQEKDNRQTLKITDRVDP